jgi:hypothetical protein
MLLDQIPPAIWDSVYWYCRLQHGIWYSLYEWFMDILSDLRSLIVDKSHLFWITTAYNTFRMKLRKYMKQHDYYLIWSAIGHSAVFFGCLLQNSVVIIPTALLYCHCCIIIIMSSNFTKNASSIKFIWACYLLHIAANSIFLSSILQKVYLLLGWYM